MGHYKSNLRDIEFNLFEVLGTDQKLGSGPFSDIDVETARGILAEVKTLAEGPLADSYVDTDRNPPVFDPAPGFPEIQARITNIRAALEKAAPPKIVVLSTIGADAVQANLLNSLRFLEEALDEPLEAEFTAQTSFMDAGLDSLDLLKVTFCGKG